MAIYIPYTYIFQIELSKWDAGTQLLHNVTMNWTYSLKALTTPPHSSAHMYEHQHQNQAANHMFHPWNSSILTISGIKTHRQGKNLYFNSVSEKVRFKFHKIINQLNIHIWITQSTITKLFLYIHMDKYIYRNIHNHIWRVLFQKALSAKLF